MELYKLKQEYKKMNVVVKRKSDAPWIITDIMATKLSKKAFEDIKEINKELLGDYEWVAQKDTDFTWWERIEKRLMPSNIVRRCYECDYYGNVEEY